MAPNGTFRRAIGVVKDQTRISFAKVASNIDPELDILIVKATSHDDIVPNDKYFVEILRRSLISKELVNECVGQISKRVDKTRDWIVALKCLILIHKLMINGGEIFLEYIACFNASEVKGGGMLSNMCVFRDEAHTNSWDYTEFVRRYGMYLDEKVELMVVDVMCLRKRMRVSGGCGGLEGEFAGSTKRVLRRMEELQRLLERVLGIRPRTVSKHEKLVIIALCPVVEESFKLYGEIGEGLSFLFEKFWGMEYWDVVKTLGTYVTVAKQIDELVEFYAWCKDFGVVTRVEYPVIERINDDLLNMMERFMKDKAIELKKAVASNKESLHKNTIEVKRRQQECSTSMTVELGCIDEDFIDKFELIDLKDDEELPKDDQGEHLALVLVSATNPWENVPGNSEVAKVTPDCETPDWELALVESANNLTKQKTEMGGGFDNLLIDSMYDQKNVEQDPFAASVAVPPPVYVQIAEMEKQQALLVQEQQVWQNYDVSSYYAYGPQAMIPYEMPRNSEKPGGEHYNPWSN